MKENWSYTEQDTKRFWNNVNKEGPIHPIHGQCWVWKKSIINGYGKFNIGSKTTKAHRFSWKVSNGSFNNLWVLHKCDNRLCVNPNHLFLGDHEDNIKDMVKKERQEKGKEHHNSKLTEDDILEIRKIYVKGSRTLGTIALGNKFGVDSSVISRIINKKRWNHI